MSSSGFRTLHGPRATQKITTSRVCNLSTSYYITVVRNLSENSIYIVIHGWPEAKDHGIRREINNE